MPCSWEEQRTPWGKLILWSKPGYLQEGHGGVHVTQGTVSALSVEVAQVKEHLFKGCPCQQLGHSSIPTRGCAQEQHHTGAGTWLQRPRAGGTVSVL